jgi:uncharacterized RDD family membrane protein YckC
MTDSSERPPPGWYYAAGDPIGTQRYWDGTQWVGDPQWVAQPAPPMGFATRDHLPELTRALAAPGRRIVARLIDLLIEIVVFMIPIGIWASSSTRELDDLQDPPSWFLLLGLAALLYEVVFVALKGATPGKMAMGIAVIRQDGTSPPGWGAAALRYLLNLVGAVPGIGGLASIVLFIVSFVFLFTDDRRRTLPDRIASTYVVDTRG